MASALEQAWETALAAPRDDQHPWRVLADMLLGEGDLRGELMQLELDAELAPLRGLARGRREALRRDLWPQLAPPGISPEPVVLERGVVVECTLRAERARDPADPRWRLVRRLRFDPWRQPEALAPWARTPLTGGQLLRVEQVDDVAEEALALLARAPPMPRLRRLGLMGDLGRSPAAAPTDWARLWPEVLPRHPRLRELELGWAGSPASGLRRLESLREADLDRVTVEASPDELVELHAWRQTVSPRFVLEASLRQRSLGARVELHPDALVLRALPGQHAAAEAQVRQRWPAHRAMPPLRTAR